MTVRDEIAATIGDHLVTRHSPTQIADALMPFLAAAWERGHEVCDWPGCARRHTNPYQPT